ncbi:regulator of nucleoside diphosphate kinase [Leeuwenhoekiella polynyae]|uniref:Regulator of nucleoside diphosphate kinase n=2 Tax=Leeuwenhoekiella polynyae TaxID=1550906 RepID=A0A4Q0P3P6_9FLAO|nr:regulator of nucleoside diphosphate kinase [Leeuwenhoekiella polynyae]
MLRGLPLSSCLGKKEYVHLKKVMNFSHHLIQDSYGYALSVLDAKLHSARIWDAQYFPNDVVRLYSNILRALDSKKQYITLILNSKGSDKSKETSVVTALGTSIWNVQQEILYIIFKDGNF